MTLILLILTIFAVSCRYINNISVLSDDRLLKVHFIDVGQADSILIQQGGKNMLIDAGNNGDADKIINYLKSNNVKKLDVIIATHPHEDHIGAMDEIIDKFDIGIIYSSGQTTTQTYKNFISSVKNKGLKLTKPEVGKEQSLGDAKFVILGPNNKEYDELNNYSIVTKLTYGSNAFIFQGDAEKLSEDEILNKGYNISADVIKIGHHGSKSSSTEAYLNAVKPKYAVICVGKNNDYDHPSETILSRLKKMGVAVYRTDQSGTIVISSDGKNITIGQ